MKNLYSLILVMFMILPAMHVSGKEVNQKKALEVATQFMNSRSTLRNGTSLKLVLTGKSENANLRSSENPSYYVYNVEGGKGFVIIAGDDVVAPILGYSFNSSFEVSLWVITCWANLWSFFAVVYMTTVAAFPAIWSFAVKSLSFFKIF